LFCYSKEEDASLGQIHDHYTSVSKHFLEQNDEGCYGTGQFDIIVEPIQNETSEEKFSVTDRAFPSNRALVSGANG
jgi:hypothetical protein